jgi:hypothetical protein
MHLQKIHPRTRRNRSVRATGKVDVTTGWQRYRGFRISTEGIFNPHTRSFLAYARGCRPGEDFADPSLSFSSSGHRLQDEAVAAALALVRTAIDVDIEMELHMPRSGPHSR